MHGFISLAIFPAILLLLTVFHAQAQVQYKKENEGEIKIFINGNYFSSFLSDKNLPKPVLYPIIDAQQRRLTRGFPFSFIPGERADHPHHYGIWLNFGDVNKVDFWNNGKYPGSAKEHNYGSVQLVGNDVTLNEKKGTLSYKAIWKGPEGSALLMEETTYHFSGTDSTREVVRESSLKALEDVTFGDSKEGFFAIRLRRELESPSATKDQYVEDTAGTISETKRHDTLIPVSGLYSNSKGDSAAAVWGQPAAWVMLEGKVEDENVAILFFDHPQNFGFPSRWMARDYGLFGVNPFGEKSYGGVNEKTTPLKKGNSLTFRYKMVFTTFIPEKEYVEKKYKEFSKKQ